MYRAATSAGYFNFMFSPEILAILVICFEASIFASSIYILL
jgi:hypothetical protein